jgi:DnaJ-class molecular chaperone
MTDQPMRACPKCSGTGKVAYDIVPGRRPAESETGDCPNCRGTGAIL